MIKTKSLAWREKLANVASYVASGYYLPRHAPKEEFLLNRRLSGYPSNHNYCLRAGKLLPSYQLFERVRPLGALYSTDMSSFLDVGCCRGFYVFHAGSLPKCRLAVGIDVHEPFIELSQSVQARLSRPQCRFYAASLAQVATDPAAFGGPFHTVLNIGAYHYLYWGSKHCPGGSLDHRTIMKNFAAVCTNRLIISGRFELDKLSSSTTSAGSPQQRENYTTAKFIEAAEEFFEVQQKGSLGTYPLFLLLRRPEREKKE